MSRDTTDKAAILVRNGEELEPAICSALATLLATEPTPAEVDCAMNQLRLVRDSVSLPVSVSSPATSNHGNSNPWLLVAASIFVFCICGIASTEGWAQVARDLSDPLNEPRALSTLAKTMSNAEEAPGDISFALRLVLLAHVTFLMIGLTGMAATWLIAILRCFLDQWGKSQPNGNSTSTQHYILFSSALIYAVGIVLGAIWAQATWGRLWSWDPRETFGLLTLAVVMLWLRAIDVQVRSDIDSWRFSTMSASIATIAQGAIVLMLVLGNRYAASLHSYGLPPLTLPNLVFSLFAVCLALIWISFVFRARFSQKVSKA